MIHKQHLYLKFSFFNSQRPIREKLVTLVSNTNSNITIATKKWKTHNVHLQN